jgi:glycosyltransferase involved in cell wall biosynthesis
VPRLLLLTPSELTLDPRARRAAEAALARGWAVAGVTGQLSGRPPAPLPGVEVVRVGKRGSDDPHLEARVAARREPLPLRELRGLARLGLVAVRTRQLVRGARGLERPDVVHAHDLDTLPAGWLLARRWRVRLVYDAHELYSSYEADPPRLYRRLALALEAALARRAHAVVTVTEPMAAELRRRLRLPAAPLVSLNCPARANGVAAGRTDGVLRVVYQAAIGVGRRIEDALDAVAEIPAAELTLRVIGADTQALRAAIAARGLEGRAHVAEPVAPDRIVAALRSHDVGLVIDRPLAGNIELTIPNKLFEYLMAGLAVVVPRVAAMGELVEREGVGLTFEQGSAASLADALRRLAEDEAALLAYRRRAREVALERYNAETQTAVYAAAWFGRDG